MDILICVCMEKSWHIINYTFLMVFDGFISLLFLFPRFCNQSHAILGWCSIYLCRREENFLLFLKNYFFSLSLTRSLTFLRSRLRLKKLLLKIHIYICSIFSSSILFSCFFFSFPEGCLLILFPQNSPWEGAKVFSCQKFNELFLQNFMLMIDWNWFFIDDRWRLSNEEEKEKWIIKFQLNFFLLFVWKLNYL